VRVEETVAAEKGGATVVAATAVVGMEAEVRAAVARVAARAEAVRVVAREGAAMEGAIMGGGGGLNHVDEMDDGVQAGIDPDRHFGSR
jgi:hypothetical protein